MEADPDFIALKDLYLDDFCELFLRSPNSVEHTAILALTVVGAVSQNSIFYWAEG